MYVHILKMERHDGEKNRPNGEDKNAVESDNSIWKLRQDESQQSMTVAFPFAANGEKQTRGSSSGDGGGSRDMPISESLN